MDADGAWTMSNICMRVPGLVGPLLRAARLLYGDCMVSSETSLSMLGVKCGAGIKLVLDRRGGDILITASKDRTVKLWNPEPASASARWRATKGWSTPRVFSPGDGVGAPRLVRPHGERMHLLNRFEKGETLTVFHGIPFSTAKRGGGNF